MRYGFGKNWKSYLKTLTPEHIQMSRKAICERTGISNFSGLRILDIGSGSGLSSLAFLQMGAEVIAYDYDQDSVECTDTLLKSMAPPDSKWKVMQGSVLDHAFMQRLGNFDVVYSWGVLHHTGSMWQAMELAAAAVDDKGILFIALYNDQGFRSKIWKIVKQIYCAGPIGRLLIKTIFFPIFFFHSVIQDIKSCHAPLTRIRNYYQNRGMSIIHDWNDWLGGYPFEVASKSEVIMWAHLKNLELIEMKTTHGLGCNEFIFLKNSKNE